MLAGTISLPEGVRSSSEGEPTSSLLRSTRGLVRRVDARCAGIGAVGICVQATPQVTIQHLEHSTP
jgi:hypothetical protein